MGACFLRLTVAGAALAVAVGSSSCGGNGDESGGSDGTGPGSGGQGGQCPPECFVANECVEACGDEPRDYGCCPCPAGTINALSCNSMVSDASQPALDAAASGAPSCDERRVLCRSLPPACDAGEVPSVDGQCWGPCVPIDSCVCTEAAECPDEGQYTCHLFRSRCGPYV